MIRNRYYVSFVLNICDDHLYRLLCLKNLFTKHLRFRFVFGWYVTNLTGSLRCGSFIFVYKCISEYVLISVGEIDIVCF